MSATSSLRSETVPVEIRAGCWAATASTSPEPATDSSVEPPAEEKALRPARSSTAPESAPDMGASSPEEESDPPPAPEQALSVVSRARQLPASSRRGEVAVTGVGRRP